MAKEFLFTDNTINNYGFRFLTEGGDLSEFMANPLMLKDHGCDTDDVIGSWANIRTDGDKIFGTTDFDMEDSEASAIARKVEKGYIKCCSIGAIPIESSEDPSLMLPGQMLPTITKWRLREVSIVPRGANKNAVVQLYDVDGNKIDMKDAQNYLRMKSGITQPKLNSMNKINELLCLAADATPTQQETAIQAIITARNTAVQERDTAVQLKDTLTTELKAFKDKEKIDLVDTAIADKKFGADMRDTYLKLFDADPEGTKAIIEKMAKVTRVADNLESGTGFQLSDEQKKWSFRDWDKAGKLVQLKDGDKELYKRLFKEEYNVDYKE